MNGFSRYYFDPLPIYISAAVNAGCDNREHYRIFSTSARRLSIMDFFQNFDCTLANFVI